MKRLFFSVILAFFASASLMFTGCGGADGTATMRPAASAPAALTVVRNGDTDAPDRIWRDGDCLYGVKDGQLLSITLQPGATEETWLAAKDLLIRAIIDSGGPPPPPPE